MTVHRQQREMKKQHQLRNKTLIAVFLTVCTLVPAQANFLQSHAEINHAVKKFVVQQNVPLKNLQVTLTSLNQQLRLPQCTKALQVEMAPGAKLLGHISLKISCASPKKWKIHVAAHIDGQVDVIIARHPIPRGTVIQSENLDFVLRQYSQLNHGYYGSANLLNNMEAKRNIKAGQILIPGFLQPQKLVLRGQHITIIAENGALKLRVKGKALMDGQQGQTIKVQNLTSKKLIYARVISAGVVRINF